MNAPKGQETRASSAGFSVSARVRAKAEFTRVFEQGRRVAHPLMALHLLREPASGDTALGGAGVHAGARLGLAVSRKVDARAVGRNRIKRALREEFRQRRAQLVPGAYVVVARTAARDAANPELRAAFVALLQRAGALPPSGAPGTMPPPT